MTLNGSRENSELARLAVEKISEKKTPVVALVDVAIFEPPAASRGNGRHHCDRDDYDSESPAPSSAAYSSHRPTIHCIDDRALSSAPLPIFEMKTFPSALTLLLSALALLLLIAALVTDQITWTRSDEQYTRRQEPLLQRTAERRILRGRGLRDPMTVEEKIPGEFELSTVATETMGLSN